ncbi:MAG: hypothetical protein JHC33_13775 [Ignisphaera sp.]|jgi:hypothetical protein|nr:hypothetical protein [Ignisphaera sp.]
MITLNQLKDFMVVIRKTSNQLDKEHALYEQLFEDFDGYSKGLATLLDGMIDVLDKHLGDNSWVSWYVFDNDFGNTGLDGITTVEELYAVILKDADASN